jgi:hypothetical protein
MSARRCAGNGAHNGPAVSRLRVWRELPRQVGRWREAGADRYRVVASRRLQAPHLHSLRASLASSPCVAVSVLAPYDA